MQKWAIHPAPSAELQAIDPEPLEVEPGCTVQRFRTRFGKVFAKRVEKSGLVKWFQLLQEA